MAENKKISANWGGKRKGAGAKKILPTGAKARSIRMTDEEYKKVKGYLIGLRNKK